MKIFGGQTMARSKLERNLARSGVIFLTPLIIGLIWFFLIPIWNSFIFSVSEVSVTGDGYITKLKGFASYYEALFVHSSYRQTVVEAVKDMVITSPLVIVFSFFMASVLNQKFKGRTLFRVILFLPVIVISTAMTSVNSADTLQSAMGSFGAYKDTFGGASVSFTNQISQYLQTIGLQENITTAITSTVDQIYSVISLSGIQILILLTGMQSISPTLYEAAKVEGCTAWESFWKITFPMVSPLILTCVVYTIVDSFTTSANGVMTLVKNMAFTNQNFSLSSAMSWVYFLIVAAILGVVSLLISRKVFYYDN